MCLRNRLTIHKACKIIYFLIFLTYNSPWTLYSYLVLLFLSIHKTKHAIAISYKDLNKLIKNRQVPLLETV